MMSVKTSPETAASPMIVREWRGRSIVVRCTRYAAGYDMPDHAHDRPTVSLMLSGSGVECAGDGRLDFNAADVAIKPADAVHATRCGDEGLLTFSIEFLRRMNAASSCAMLQYGWTRRRLSTAMTTMLLDLTANRGVDEAFRPVGRIVGDAPLPKLTMMAPSGAMKTVVQSLRANSATAPSCADIAVEAGMHPGHLRRLIREHFGCSLSTLRQRRRASEAMTAIVRRPQLCLAAIALEVGFADQSHMTRTFRRYVGVTPGRYRRMLQSIVAN